MASFSLAVVQAAVNRKFAAGCWHLAISPKFAAGYWRFQNQRLICCWLLAAGIWRLEKVRSKFWIKFAAGYWRFQNQRLTPKDQPTNFQTYKLQPKTKD